MKGCALLAVEVLAFADEEGVRFGTGYLGSSVVAGHFDTADPLAPAHVESHADLAADLLIRALEIDGAAHSGDQGSANGKRRRG